MSKVLEQAKIAKKAAVKLAVASTEIKNKALTEIADTLDKNRETILKENKKDLEQANGLSNALIKRLKLDNTKINEMIEEMKSLIDLVDPVDKTLDAMELDKDLELYQVTCPIGVIGAIFESRPDALVQITGLCIKSGNAVILKGGSEASHSNKILTKIITPITDKAAIGCVQLIETREEVSEILKLDQYIDLLIPRGSNKFVRYIQDNSRIAVLGHSDGICHVFVDKDADIDKALTICFDAKCQYSAVCNAMETLLVHEDIAKDFLPLMVKKYQNVELRGDKAVRKIVDIKEAKEDDWDTEYNDLVLSIKIVKDIDEAIEHINEHGSKHTDAIVTENEKIANNFMNLVDSSSVMWNCSTRFADGFRYGKGAEVGISTAKIHARGPVGLDGLIIYKYFLKGNGQVVEDYSGKNAKSFSHRKMNKKW